MTRSRIGTRFAVWYVVAATIATIALPQVVHVDVLPDLDTYGLSIGANATYCSMDLVAGGPSFSCQSGS